MSQESKHTSGTIGAHVTGTARWEAKAELPPREAVINQFDRDVGLMEGHPWFYEWALSVWDQMGLPADSAICDIGCGTGALLSRLHARGYRRLSGTDFAPSCVVTAQRAVPSANIFIHDIERAPLPGQYDAAILTGVFDFFVDPMAALRNIRASLKPGGVGLITIRNRLAYWPWYHLRGLASAIPSARLRHWFLWFTTPLGMRRTDYPYEHVYSPAEARALLRSGGLPPVAEHGFQRVPMLWIPEFPAWITLMRRIEGWARPLPGKAGCYWYMFVCTPEQE